MIAFLKIDTCKGCRRSIPWEWAPAVLVGGRALTGTGVWRTQLMEGYCPGCKAGLQEKREQERRASVLRTKLIDLLGGEIPYRDFTFERYTVTAGNERAFQRCRNFNPKTENLYLWGLCGVGKTHLAYAIARHAFERGHSIEILTPPRLVRKVRMRDPDTEQAVIHHLAGVAVLVIDELGIGSDTAYGRQIIQEILDTRAYHGRGGLVITTQYALGVLAHRMQDATIPSRLAGMCKVVEIKGRDRRLLRVAW